MDQCHCKRCGKTVTRVEDHPCLFHKKFDYRYSQSRPAESEKHHDEIKDKTTENSNDSSRCLSPASGKNENKKSQLMNLLLFQNNEKEKSLSSKKNIVKTFSENSGKEQQRTPSDSSYFNPFSNAQLIEVQTNENASFTTSSGNVVSGYRTENNQCEAYEKMIVVTRTSAIDMQKQIGSDLMHATTDEEYKMSLEKRKWQTLNNDKNSFMDSLECVIRNSFSDNKNASVTANVILELDLPPESKKPRNDKRGVSENINKHIALEVNSHLYYKNGKRAANAKEAICNKEADNAVAGPSGFSSRKKKLDKTSSEKDALKTNDRRYTAYKRFFCDICKKQFSQKSSLNRHYITHTGEAPYVCDVCGKIFSQKTDFIIHHRFHTGDRPFVCEVCNKGFAHKGNLIAHLKMHTGEKPFVCDVCNEAFAQKGTLQTHARTHTGEKPFVCDVCNEAFARKGTLKTHARTHTGEKPFLCDVCNEAFAQKGTLKTHARTHTGEKPYKCPICGMAFTTSSLCNRHRRRVHK
ncbi:zinc finger protein 436-like [Argiope bruennichi]|uniref:zinc finger protein 436-like n=1 Tax=Argiope bruennichi TaxID=94029 RepID=UPI0024950A00|nr:zinc finger protein 436-like [Argiope bruennichi]